MTTQLTQDNRSYITDKLDSTSINSNKLPFIELYLTCYLIGNILLVNFLIGG